MSMYLSGSANTGKKIMKNFSKFAVTFDRTDENNYFFNWSFDNYQSGHICIVLNDKNEITQDSLMSCKNNQRSFKSTLGLYKDPSLRQVFEYIMNHYTPSCN